MRIGKQVKELKHKERKINKKIIQSIVYIIIYNTSKYCSAENQIHNTIVVLKISSI